MKSSFSWFSRKKKGEWRATINRLLPSPEMKREGDERTGEQPAAKRPRQEEGSAAAPAPAGGMGGGGGGGGAARARPRPRLGFGQGLAAFERKEPTAEEKEKEKEEKEKEKKAKEEKEKEMKEKDADRPASPMSPVPPNGVTKEVSVKTEPAPGASPTAAGAVQAASAGPGAVKQEGAKESAAPKRARRGTVEEGELDDDEEEEGAVPVGATVLDDDVEEGEDVEDLPPPKTKLEILPVLQEVDEEISGVEAELKKLRMLRDNPVNEVEQGSGEGKKRLSQIDLQELLLENRKKAEQAHELLRTQVADPAPLDPDAPPVTNLRETDVYKKNVELFRLQKGGVSKVLTVRYLEHVAAMEELAIEYEEKQAEYDYRCIKAARHKVLLASLAAADAADGDAASLKKARVAKRATEVATSADPDFKRSDYQMSAIMDSVTDGRPESQIFRRTLAVIPDMILNERERLGRYFIDNNGFTADPMAAETEHAAVNPWTEQEKSTFAARFRAHPKNFRKISSYLPNKSIGECVQFYYRNKRRRNLATGATKKRGASKVVQPTSRGDRAVGGGGDLDGGADMGIWSETERLLFLDVLGQYGCDFNVIAEYVSSKDAVQCKQFYQNYRKKFNLDQIVANRITLGGRRRTAPSHFS